MQDSIEVTIDLKAPIARVWQAITDYREFGAWFRVRLDNPFEVGKITTGEMTHPSCEGMPWWARVVKMEAPTHFEFVWPMDETVKTDDPDLARKTTRGVFRLEETPEGTRLTITESGFSGLPEEKRMSVLRTNSEGWEIQRGYIREYMEQLRG